MYIQDEQQMLQRLQALKNENNLPDLAVLHDGWILPEQATFLGHLAVLQWFVADSGQRIDLAANDNAILHLASCRRHSHILHWLLVDSGYPFDYTVANNSFFQSAAASGQCDAIEYAAFNSGQLNRILQHDLQWLKSPNLPEPLRHRLQSAERARVQLQAELERLQDQLLQTILADPAGVATITSGIQLPLEELLALAKKSAAPRKRTKCL